MKNKFKPEKYIKQRYSNRTGLWSFQVSITYTDPDGRTTSFNETFAEKNYLSARQAWDEAIAFRNARIKELKTTGSLYKSPASPPTVQQVFERSFELFPLARSTRHQRELHCKYIKDYLQTPITAIRSSDIQITLNALRTTKSDKIIRDVCGLWKRIIQTAIMDDLINNDPMLKVKLPKSDRPAPNRDQRTDMKAFLTIVNSLSKITGNRKNDWDRWIIVKMLWFIAYTGCRPAEALARKKSDIDWDGMVINMATSIGSTEDEDNAIKRTKNDGSIRTLPIPPKLIPTLRELCDRQPDEFLFAFYGGAMPTTKHISSMINYRATALGVTFSMYRLRHLFSTDMLDAGVDIRTVMELMGHVSPSTTLSYARSDMGKKRQAIENRKLN